MNRTVFTQKEAGDSRQSGQRMQCETSSPLAWFRIVILLDWIVGLAKYPVPPENQGTSAWGCTTPSSLVGFQRDETWGFVWTA